jgi:hypothetical protein
VRHDPSASISMYQECEAIPQPHSHIGAHNDCGIQIDHNVPASEQFRSLVGLARGLSKNPGLPTEHRLICELLVDSASVMLGLAARKAPRRTPSR